MKIGYARVSTVDQNLDMQIDALKKEGCEKVFCEKASGAKRDRPELLKAIEYARSGDILVVWRLDRLARSLSQIINTVEDLERRNIEILSIGEKVDTSTASGKLFFHNNACYAEFERNLIRERVIAGVRAAQAKGIICGRKRLIDEKKIQAAKLMLQDERNTVKEICNILGISKTSLYFYIKGGRGSVKDGVS